MALNTKEYTLDAGAVEAVSAELQAYLKERRVEAPAADPAGRVAGQNPWLYRPRDACDGRSRGRAVSRGGRRVVLRGFASGLQGSNMIMLCCRKALPGAH